MLVEFRVSWPAPRAPGNEDGGVCIRLTLPETDLEVDLMGECDSLYPRSEPSRREDIDSVSGWTREVLVRTDELLDFFESGRGSRKKEVFDVADQTLAVSLVSLEVDRRPVALLKRLVTPDAAEVFECMDVGRGSTWKFERGRDVATT